MTEIIPSPPKSIKKSSGYLPEWVDKIMDGRNILDVALDVHMTTTGSYERSFETGEKDQENDILVLKHYLAKWKVGLPQYEEFDEAVKNVIVCAIKEAI